MDALREVLIYNRHKNPERTNATPERLMEVLENVCDGRAAEHIDDLKTILGAVEWRRPMRAQEADKIIEYFASVALPRHELNEIVRQLRYSEISTAEAIDVHRKHKIPVSRPEEDIIPVKGEGCWIMDTKGRWFLDMDSNYSATNIGMSNEEIARGLYNQASLLISMKEDRIQIARTRFLKEIMPMMPEGLDQFYWQNSGGEAVDKSLKLAKAFTGSTAVIAFKGGFHGRTHAAVSVTWNPKYRRPFGLEEVDWVHFAEFNDIEDVRRQMDRTGAKIVILEMVQGEEAGNRPAEPSFIDELWHLVRERGGVIVDDEVQAGFGRTAQKEGDWFACMSYGKVPDIMAIGKSFGGGYPVTAVVARPEISRAMKPGYDGSTFGGNPMAMTAALIATRQMREKAITRNVIERSRQLFDGLRKVLANHAFAGDLRGRGLMIAFGLESTEQVAQLQEALRKQGVKSSLATDRYIRFLPPTIISQGEVHYFLNGLDAALKAVGEMRYKKTVGGAAVY